MSSNQKQSKIGKKWKRPHSNIQPVQGTVQETDTIRPEGYGDDSYRDYDKTKEKPKRDESKAAKKGIKAKALGWAKKGWSRIHGDGESSTETGSLEQRA
ncbi:hypothetical protein FOPE_00083 [Fonsecaea pedrosoi]|nr:hypothetical protein FOPE_00083 [Fonsecaea pedrosoi]